MILADTSVWIDHLRSPDAALAALLDRERIVTHDHVIGEIALGNLRNPHAVIGALEHLPRLETARDDEVRAFIVTAGIAGSGIGYVDAHLLAALRLAPGTTLWTRDKRLHAVAQQLGLAATPT